MSSQKSKDDKADSPFGAADRLSVRPLSGTEKRVRRPFPGPRAAQAVLRVALDRGAYAELIAHAKESLEAEVCGVMAGNVCEDDEGVFLHMEAVIRGTAANEGSTHVTFTQATWNAIHGTLERNHPKLKILGWYHTHPGFGVEFSEMDLFIQRNFFSGPTQIALVTDPLNGDVAIAANTPQGIEYLARFWVDGREHTCRVPAELPGQSAALTAQESPGDTARTLQALEARLSQLVQTVDDLRTTYCRFLTCLGIVTCLALITAVGYTIFVQFRAPLEPPRLNSYVPVPVQIGDKTVLLGVGVAEWEVPPELNAVLLQMEQLKREAEEKAAKKSAEQQSKRSSNGGAGTNRPPGEKSSNTTNERK